MPVKLPKGFLNRRKSSINALDEVRSPPGAGEPSSFKVLERPPSKGNAFDGGAHLRLASTGAPRPPSKDRYSNTVDDTFAVSRPDAGNRGSGGTEHSRSTAPYDSAASSARLSTSSTNPSSVDTRSDKNIPGDGSRPFNDIPVPPPTSARPGFLRDTSRTFSFGIGRPDRESPTSPNGLPPLVDNRRNRTVTESTASTATPPKLFDSDLALENTELDDGFGSMFDHIGSSPDPAPRLIHQQAIDSSPITNYPPTAYSGVGAFRASRAPPPQPISTNRSQTIESSPYSWNSQHSHDGLMRSPSPSKTVTQGSPLRNRQPSLPPHGRYGSMSEASASVPSRKPVGQRPLAQEQDLHPQPLSPTKSRESNAPSTSSARNAIGLSPASEDSATFDTDMAENAQLANMYQETKEALPKTVSTNKVMTPAQWERYKQQKEMDRRLGGLSDDSDSEAGDHSDDDDELERSKQAAIKRRKQEAHLAIYRQKMMKVTGEAMPNRPGSSLSALRPAGSSSAELNRMSHMTLDSKNSGGSSGQDEDEDEDVPLGILAAHGFPNKNRAPTRLANSPSNSNLRVVSQGQGAPSVKGGALPVFARQLPPDPYYGAGLVSQPNREQLALHPTAVPQGAGPSTSHPIHPSGLVGVIAGEERARAARRGSPNTAGNYEMPQLPPHPGMARSQTTGTLGYAQGMPPIITAGDQAQIHMANQMNQIMQMQMQWMQQISQQMGGQMNPNQMGMPQYPGSHDFTGQRPQSAHMQHSQGPAPSQRTMSTLNPSMAPWNSGQSMLPSINVNGNYAPSIAPSERSNVGLASRYRPVSIAPEPAMGLHHRASTFTSSSVRPWSTADNAPRTSQYGARPPMNSIGRKSPLAVQDDDDDEQAWAEMKMKKDKKQKNWALRKGQNALQELYNPAS